MMRIRLSIILTRTLLLFLLSTNLAHATAEACFEASNQDFSEVLSCYTKAEAAKPLTYTAKGKQVVPGVDIRSYDLLSGQWSPENLVSPQEWQHAIDIYIPENALHGRALLLANNGTRTAGDSKEPSGPTDFTQANAIELARKTRTIVISINNVPNQHLTYADDAIARTEDASVAHSWKLFLEDPLKRPFMTVRLPMVVALTKAMDLAQRELPAWQIDRFILSGVSKRGWAAWLAAIADNRVDGIVPFAIDILGTNKVLEHTFQAYGKHWPLAFYDYQHEGITRQFKTENFARLMKIEDPLHYLDSAYADRLAIPKYIVNASSDDFFLPDNSDFFYDQLPGPKALRVAPNASHYGVKQFIETSLVPVINRWQQGRALPIITASSQQQGGARETMRLNFSEVPVRVTQWTATNPTVRDFRYPCAVRYEARDITAAARLDAQVSIDTPVTGWNATFVEATFADGFVATTPVLVLPRSYPDTAPPVIEPGCKTISDEERR